MNHIQGRADLAAWEQAKPTNFYTSDTNLQAVLQHYVGEAFDSLESSFSELGALSAQVIDPAVRVEDRIGNHPKLQRYDGIGNRIEAIEFHPNHDLVGRIVAEAGVMAIQATPGNTVQQMTLFYLLCLNGEAGHMCGLACTSGLIRALQSAASDNLRDKFLPPLLSRDFDQRHDGAQFLTEVQGGSDVGANSIQAILEDDTWRITGEKWFCSNVQADQFLMTARAADATGTKGLGLFLVPRLLDNGSINYFAIRRLKDKLGTRTLASAELDFNGAVAYPIGSIETGFKTVVELVLNTSRLMNAVSCASIMRRAYYEASQYACYRVAFGNALATYPLVQEAIADLHSEACAATASTFYLAHLVDRMDTNLATDAEKSVYRLLVNVNKYITSVRGSQMVHTAIEALGGNGAIESFSVLPRLYRDMVVLESWEGTHNVLALQVLRDIARFKLHEPFFTTLRAWLNDITREDLQDLRSIIGQSIGDLGLMLARLSKADDVFQQAHARRLIDRIGLITQATLLLQQCQQTNDILTFDLASYFVNKHLRVGYNPMDDEGYLGRLERVMLDV